MRERSKNAARTRREKENHEFSELARLLPHPSSSTANMDKATVVKLTTAYLKLRSIFPYGIGTPWGSQTQDKFLRDHAAFLVKSLEGFLIVVGPNLKTIYVSEGVSFYLGLSQTEMMGNSIMDYIHVGDHEEFKSLLKHEEIVPREDQIHEEMEISRCFSLRMKCTLTKRCAGLVRDSYKVIIFRGYLKMVPTSAPSHRHNINVEVRYQAAGFVAAGNAVHPTTSLELKMHSNTFMCRAELDLSFLHVEDRIKELTGYDPQHLRHKSLYKFVHVCDAFKLNEDHTQLLKKGQAVSSYYRFLTLNGGWIWIQSSFIMLLNSKSRHSFILSINHALSDAECKEYLLEEEQLTKPSSLECEENGRSVHTKNSTAPEILKVPVKVKKKLSTECSVKNNSCDQFASPSTYVDFSNMAVVPFANHFLPLTCIQSDNMAMVPNGCCIQPANPTVSFVSDLPSITQNNLASHAPVPFNNLRGSWYSGENANYSSSTVAPCMQIPVNSTYNTTTDHYNTFPVNSNSTSFGSTHDPFYNFSMYTNSDLASHSVNSVEYSEPHPKLAKRSCTETCSNGTSCTAEQLPFYVEPIHQDSLNSAQGNHESIQNHLVTPSPVCCRENETNYSPIYNDVSSCNDRQPFYTEPVDNYGDQIHNLGIPSSPTNTETDFNSTCNNSNSPCCEQSYYGEQVSTPNLTLPVDTRNEAYSNSDKTNPILSRSDCLPENSTDRLEHITGFALPEISSEAGIFSNNADNEQLQTSHTSSAPCSTEQTRNQTENMHFDDYSYSEKLTFIETTDPSIEPLKSSLQIDGDWSLHNYNSVSRTVDSLVIRNENVLSMSKTQHDELSPVSANSLSSDPNTDRTYITLNSSSDYSNGYTEEAEKDLAGLNFNVSFNPVTNFRKDFMEFSSFENRASSTPLYTTL